MGGIGRGLVLVVEKANPTLGECEAGVEEGRRPRLFHRLRSCWFVKEHWSWLFFCLWFLHRESAGLA